MIVNTELFSYRSKDCIPIPHFKTMENMKDYIISVANQSLSIKIAKAVFGVNLKKFQKFADLNINSEKSNNEFIIPYHVSEKALTLFVDYLHDMSISDISFGIALEFLRLSATFFDNDLFQNLLDFFRNYSSEDAKTYSEITSFLVNNFLLLPETVIHCHQETVKTIFSSMLSKSKPAQLVENLGADHNFSNEKIIFCFEFLFLAIKEKENTSNIEKLLFIATFSKLFKFRADQSETAFIQDFIKKNIDINSEDIEEMELLKKFNIENVLFENKDLVAENQKLNKETILLKQEIRSLNSKLAALEEKQVKEKENFQYQIDKMKAIFEESMKEIKPVVDLVKATIMDDLLEKKKIKELMEKKERAPLFEFYQQGKITLLEFFKALYDQEFFYDYFLTECCDKIFDTKENGDTAAAFHENCDGVPYTITHVETEDGDKFAAFTTKAWTSEEYQFFEDKEAFILSITKNKIIPIDNDYNCAIECNKGNGPVFGSYDLSLSDCCTNNDYSFSSLKGSYGFKDDNITETFLLGKDSDKFKVKSYQVYEVNK